MFVYFDPVIAKFNSKSITFSRPRFNAIFYFEHKHLTQQRTHTHTQKHISVDIASCSMDRFNLNRASFIRHRLSTRNVNPTSEWTNESAQIHQHTDIRTLTERKRGRDHPPIWMPQRPSQRYSWIAAWQRVHCLPLRQRWSPQRRQVHLPRHYFHIGIFIMALVKAISRT